MSASRRTAVITGASSGIGAATARDLAARGFDVVVGARRIDRLKEVAADCERSGVRARALPLDVTDPVSVEQFTGEIAQVDVLINNAGGAKGLAPVAEADEEQWRWMYDANVLGVMRVTKALLPRLVASGDGHIVVVGSVAGIEAYPGGGGYTAAKHGVHAVSQTLRQELLGQPVRVTEIAPGLVETEFSYVRLGDQDAADQVYAGMTPLTAEDVADVIGFVVTRPSHVCLDFVLLKPTDQATATRVHRRN